MRELPTLFRAPMVRALLAGRMTQTRLPMKPSSCYFGSAPPAFWDHADFTDAFVDGELSQYLHVAAHEEKGCAECERMGWDGTRHRLWPRMAPASEWQQEPDRHSGYVPPASRLWVRETWRRWDNGGRQIAYRADLQCLEATEETGHWLVFDAGNRLRSDPGGWSSAIQMPRWMSRFALEVTRVRAQRLHDIDEEDALAEGITALGGVFSFDSPRAGVHDTAVAAYRELWESIHGKGSWEATPWIWAISFNPSREGDGHARR